MVKSHRNHEFDLCGASIARSLNPISSLELEFAVADRGQQHFDITFLFTLRKLGERQEFVSSFLSDKVHSATAKHYADQGANPIEHAGMLHQRRDLSAIG